MDLTQHISRCYLTEQPPQYQGRCTHHIGLVCPTKHSTPSAARKLVCCSSAVALRCLQVSKEPGPDSQELSPNSVLDIKVGVNGQLVEILLRNSSEWCKPSKELLAAITTVVPAWGATSDVKKATGRGTPIMTSRMPPAGGSGGAHLPGGVAAQLRNSSSLAVAAGLPPCSNNRKRSYASLSFLPPLPVLPPPGLLGVHQPRQGSPACSLAEGGPSFLFQMPHAAPGPSTQQHMWPPFMVQPAGLQQGNDCLPVPFFFGGPPAAAVAGRDPQSPHLMQDQARYGMPPSFKGVAPAVTAIQPKAAAAAPAPGPAPAPAASILERPAGIVTQAAAGDLGASTVASGVHDPSHEAEMCMAQEGAAAVDDSMSDEETAEEAAAAAASEEEAPAADQPPGQLAPGTKVSLDGDDGSSRPLTVVRTLGRGGYATVYDVEDEDGNHWALKVARGCDGYKGDIKKRDLFAAAVQQSLTNEAILLQTISQKSLNIVRCQASGTLEGGPASGRLALLLELCECDLATYLQREGPISEEQAFTWMEQILNGLQAIHGCNVLHRDLKSSNILLSRTTREVRLCDFGVSVDLNNLDAKAKKFIFGSAGSQAPEVLSKKAQQGTGVDIWGVGIVWWEMLLGRHPYPEIIAEPEPLWRYDLTQDFVRFMDQKMQEHGLSSQAQAVVSSCLKWDARSRGKAATILKNMRKVYKRRPGNKEGGEAG